MENKPEIKIRHYEDGDEKQIIELFNSTFQKNSTEKEWKWKFGENPYSPPLATVGVDPSDKTIVAQYTIMPIRVNVMGKPYLAGQSIDTMVEARQRGKRLFEKTAEACYETFTESGGTLVYGFPNDNSYPGFMRKLQWKRVGYLYHYSYRVGVSAFLLKVSKSEVFSKICDSVYRSSLGLFLKIKKKFLKMRADSSLQVKESSELPEEVNALWKATASYLVFSLYKDHKYLEWRYTKNPNNLFSYISIWKEDTLHGLAVIGSKDEKTLFISELIVRDRDIEASKLLIMEILINAQKNGFQKVDFVGRDAGFFDSVFHDFRRNTHFGFVFCLRNFKLEEVNDILIHSDNWSLTLGDIDTL